MNNLKEINIKNCTCIILVLLYYYTCIIMYYCLYYYFNDKIKIEDFEFAISIDKKSNKNIVVYNLLCKPIVY